MIFRKTVTLPVAHEAGRLRGKKFIAKALFFDLDRSAGYVCALARKFTLSLIGDFEVSPVTPSC
jgi:hypothetical protein